MKRIPLKDVKRPEVYNLNDDLKDKFPTLYIIHPYIFIEPPSEHPTEDELRKMTAPGWVKNGLLDVVLHSIKPWPELFIQKTFISTFGIFRFWLNEPWKNDTRWYNTTRRIVRYTMLGVARDSIKTCVICGDEAKRRPDVIKYLPLCIQHYVQYINEEGDYLDAK